MLSSPLVGPPYGPGPGPSWVLPRPMDVIYKSVRAATGKGSNNYQKKPSPTYCSSSSFLWDCSSSSSSLYLSLYPVPLHSLLRPPSPWEPVPWLAVNQVICEPIYLGLLTGRLSLFLGRFLVRQGAFAEQIAYLFLRRLCLGYLDYKKQDGYWEILSQSSYWCVIPRGFVDAEVERAVEGEGFLGWLKNFRPSMIMISDVCEVWCTALLWRGVINVAGNPSEFCVPVAFLKQS